MPTRDGAYTFSTAPLPQTHHPDPKSRRSKSHPHNTDPDTHQLPHSLAPPSSSRARSASYPHRPQLADQIHCSMDFASCRRHDCSRRGGSRDQTFCSVGSRGVGRRRRGGLLSMRERECRLRRGLWRFWPGVDGGGGLWALISMRFGGGGGLGGLDWHTERCRRDLVGPLWV